MPRCSLPATTAAVAASSTRNFVAETPARSTRSADTAVLDRQAAERATQAVERQTEIEQRAEHHVARRAGEAVEYAVRATTTRYLVRDPCCRESAWSVTVRTVDLDVSLFLQAAVPDVAEDDVIDHVDPHQHARRNQPLRQLDVVLARLRIA